MKKIIGLTSLIVVVLLAACEQSTPELSTTSLSGLRFVTDVEAAVEPLTRFSDVILAENAAKVAISENAGLVMYTPDPEHEWFVPREIDFFPPHCMLILCDDEGKPVPDPRLGTFTVAQDLLAAYVTPTLIERAAEFGYSTNDLKKINGAELSSVVAEAGLSVGKYIPGSYYNRFCRQQPVPRICFFIEEEAVFDTPELEDFDKLGVVISDYNGLVSSGLAEKLVQVHGEGVDPVLSGVQVGLSETFSEAAAREFLVNVSSLDAQLGFAEAGLIPVTRSAFEETVTGAVREHVEAAAEATFE